MAGSNAIDLSRLPPPQVVQVPDFEALLAELKADLGARLVSLAPALTLESEPVVKLLEAFAYRLVLERDRSNQASRAVMTAFATQGDLDHLGLLVGVTRLIITPADPIANTPAVLEGDDDLRRRIVLAPEGFSTAGPEGAYVFHALSASGQVRDASCTSPAPGEVVVTVLSRAGDGSASAELLDLVEVALSASDVRPLTDHVTVQSATIVAYAVQAQVFTYVGPDPTLVVDESRRRLAGYVAETFALGRDVTRSGLFAAMHVAGVQRVVLTAPAADVVVDPTQAAGLTTAEVAYAGTAE